MEKNLICYIVMLFAVLGCNGKKVDLAPQRILTGINGEAVYVYGNSGEIKGMFKARDNNEDYLILLKRDTIHLGDKFHSTILVTNDSFRVVIKKPTEAILSHKNENEGYNFSPDHEGTYDFQGLIEYDSIQIPFEYKFIVLEE